VIAFANSSTEEFGCDRAIEANAVVIRMERRVVGMPHLAPSDDAVQDSTNQFCVGAQASQAQKLGDRS
jgi:hypothetical protein